MTKTSANDDLGQVHRSQTVCLLWRKFRYRRITLGRALRFSGRFCRMLRMLCRRCARPLTTLPERQPGFRCVNLAERPLI